MPLPTNIALFGFMATGKSTVGKLLAGRLGWAFVDIDALIEEHAGMSITEIFATEGEQGFRARESEQVQRAATMRNTVIATGGGVVLDPRNMEALAASALLVCLTLSPEETYARIRHDCSRPLLQHPDPLVRIRELQAERAPHYARIALQINRDGLTPQQTADTILKHYQELT